MVIEVPQHGFAVSKSPLCEALHTEALITCCAVVVRNKENDTVVLAHIDDKTCLEESFEAILQQFPPEQHHALEFELYSGIDRDLRAGSAVPLRKNSSSLTEDVSVYLNGLRTITGSKITRYTNQYGIECAAGASRETTTYHPERKESYSRLIDRHGNDDENERYFGKATEKMLLQMHLFGLDLNIADGRTPLVPLGSVTHKSGIRIAFPTEISTADEGYDAAVRTLRFHGGRFLKKQLKKLLVENFGENLSKMDEMPPVARHELLRHIVNAGILAGNITANDIEDFDSLDDTTVKDILLELRDSVGVVGLNEKITAPAKAQKQGKRRSVRRPSG